MSKRRKKSNFKNIIILVISIISAIIVYFGGNLSLKNETENQNVIAKEPTFSKEDVTDEFLKIYFLDVGQADSTLIINNNQTMLIDAGNNEDGNLIVEFIKSLGIEKIDYLVGTHAHEDHIGGMDDIINNFNIGTVYLPYTTEKTTTTKTFEDVLDSLIAKKLSITTANIGDKFTLGNTNCEIMYVDNSEPEDTNDQSICIRLELKNESFLFMGDASGKVEKARNWPQTNVLKVAHHGSKTSTSKEFLKQVKPQIAIISVGKDNSYKHPSEQVLERLESIKAKIYRTDELGTILLISDGDSNTVEKIKTNTDGN